MCQGDSSNLGNKVTTLAVAGVGEFERARFMNSWWAGLWERVILAFGWSGGPVGARITSRLWLGLVGASNLGNKVTG